MNRITHNLVVSLVVTAFLLVPVRLGLSGGLSVSGSAAHAVSVGEMPPCHGSGQPADAGSDDCTEHCWRTVHAHRTVMPASFAPTEAPTAFFGTVDVSRPGCVAERAFELDYIGLLFRKRHVSTVVLRN